MVHEALIQITKNLIVKNSKLFLNQIVDGFYTSTRKKEEKKRTDIIAPYLYHILMMY
jgi:hypothetical protein